MTVYRQADLRCLLKVEASARIDLVNAQRSLREDAMDAARTKLAAIRSTLDARHPTWREHAP